MSYMEWWHLSLIYRKNQGLRTLKIILIILLPSYICTKCLKKFPVKIFYLSKFFGIFYQTLSIPAAYKISLEKTFHICFIYALNFLATVSQKAWKIVRSIGWNVFGKHVWIMHVYLCDFNLPLLPYIVVIYPKT